jgi:hypothetical protein
VDILERDNEKLEPTKAKFTQQDTAIRIPPLPPQSKYDQ